MSKIRTSLKSKLLLFFLIVSLIPLIVSLLFQCFYFYNTNTQSIENYESDIAKTNTQTINLWLNNSVSTLTTLYKSHPEFKNADKDKIVPILKEIHNSDAESEYYFFVDKDGNTFIDNGKTTNIADRSYFKQAKDTKQVLISDVIVSRTSGNKVINVVVPIIDDSGNFQGLICDAVNIITVEKVMKSIKIGQSGYGYLVAQDGTLITYPNEKLIGKNLEDTLIRADQRDIVKDKVYNNNKGSINYYDIYGIRKLASFEKISQANWTLIVTAPYSEIYNNVARSVYISLSIILIAIAFVITISLFVSRYISNPIIKISDIMDKASKGDLTQKLEIRDKDEIGQLMENINKTFGSLSRIIGNVIIKSRDLDISAENLSACAQEIASSSLGVSMATQNVAKGSYYQSRDLSEIMNMMDNFSKLLDKIYNSLNHVKDNSDLTQSLSQDGSNELSKLNLSIQDITESFDKVCNNINTLDFNVKKIEEITELIKSISYQTNLLSLNASIEAARAGEAGRGFSVVAQEIGHLAEQSRNSTENISNIVKEILLNMSNVDITSSKMKEKLISQIETVGHTTKSFEGILDSVFKTGPSINQAHSDIDNMLKDKDIIINKMQSISVISEETTSTSEEVSASAQEMNASTEEISTTIQELRNVSNELIKSVAVFKIQGDTEN
ncbi:methyl-accepting chemotaxis protein [Clostridium magnum]|uniref:Methyl-accepting chemotaxis protein McpB n=1 Tax=Clostridium magnum DSM 2767 TaxID=1121326 RepID=A0A162U780_9CLOT|nr:methyl-accepting chemotaxis protein [Clostridium magnum]KZL93611.1 methyl-accepting chemotaxis protein McpB [Clostridium magnum DSM 2767]SHI57922.1 methyl-accepting chemotaxis sensory transducer with Cache sensor [Clostridium magnum DSM 2767]